MQHTYLNTSHTFTSQHLKFTLKLVGPPYRKKYVLKVLIEVLNITRGGQKAAQKPALDYSESTLSQIILGSIEAREKFHVMLFL